MFRIGSGPWEKLFEGSFQKHQMQVCSSPESIIMIAILEQENGETKGMISEFYKIYHASGSVETFTETLPRELLVLTKHDAKKTIKFLAVGSGASYAEWSEDSVILETNSLLSRLNASSQMIKDVSKAYDLSLTELKDCPAEIREEFFTYPLLLPSLATNYHAMQSQSSAGIAAAEGMEQSGKIIAGEIVLGITRDGQVIEEPLSLLMRTVVFDGIEANRNQIMQVLIEGALLSNIPSVIFEWNEEFEGLGLAAKDSGQKLKEFKLEIEPIGFPAKKFNAGIEVQANISVLDPQGFLELFGINESSPAGKIIIQAMTAKQSSSMQELSETIKKTGLSTEVTVYQQLKAQRVINLAQLRYPKFFGGKNNIEEISKNWVRAIGRASIIGLSQMDSRQAILLIESIVKEMLQSYKEKGASSKPKSMLFIPELQKLAKHYRKKSVQSAAKALKELKDYGVGFAVSTDRQIDLEEELAKSIEAEVGIVMQNDAGVKLQNRKQYRVLFRPTISEFNPGAK